MTIEELFEDFYQNVKNDEWPSLDELQQSDHISDEILTFVVHAYQLPDEEKDRLDKIETLCRILKIPSIPDHIIAGNLPDSNQLFYNTLRQDTWPEYDEFLSTDNKSSEIVQELYDYFVLPNNRKHESKRDVFCEVFWINSAVSLSDSGPEDPNYKLYHHLQKEHWPDYDQFVSADDKPLDIVQELYDNFEPPGEANPTDKFQIFRKIFNISDQVLKPIKNARIKMHNYFFWSTIDFYQSKPDFLNQLTGQYPKPLSFDVLLGRQKFHRDLIYKGIDHRKNYVTYMTQENTNLSACNHNNFVWPAGISSPESPVFDTAEEVVVDSTIVSLSQIIPIDIYNQTAYSLVCESLSSNSFSFFTEKIIKPMLAKRLFIVCSGQYFLRNLRSLGFQTFDGIVDESYDQEWQIEKRVDLILKEVDRLCSLNQQQVYESAQSILDHNYQLLMNRDWQKEMIQLVQLELLSVHIADNK